MTTVVFHRLATADFLHARRRYARHSATLAGRFERAVGDAHAVVLANPAAGTSSTPPYLWVRVKRFPFYLHYGPVAPDVWRVYAVAHGSRRPNYWLRRVARP